MPTPEISDDLPTPETSQLREYWDAAPKLSDLEIACFLMDEKRSILSAKELSIFCEFTEDDINNITRMLSVNDENDELAESMEAKDKAEYFHVKAALRNFRAGWATDEAFKNGLNTFIGKLKGGALYLGVHENWNLDPRINTKLALREAKDPDKFDGAMCRLFNEWPIKHFKNLEGMDNKFYGFIKDAWKAVEKNKGSSEDGLEAYDAVISSKPFGENPYIMPEATMHIGTMIDNTPALKQKMQSLCTDIALQGLRNFCGPDGISSDFRDMFKLDDLLGNKGELSEEEQLKILGKLLENYVGLVATPNQSVIAELCKQDKNEATILKTGVIDREINKYLMNGVLTQQLPYLLSLIKFEKQLELSKQLSGEDDPVYKSSQQLLNQCHKEFRLLLEDPKKNKDRLDELKKVMDSGARILKDPQNAKQVDKVDQFVENAAHVKKHEIKSKCYQFAADVCGLMGIKEKQVKYTQKARDSLHSIQIYHGNLFSNSANKKQPAVKEAEQTSSMKEKIQAVFRRR